MDGEPQASQQDRSQQGGGRQDGWRQGGSVRSRDQQAWLARKRQALMGLVDAQLSTGLSDVEMLLAIGEYQRRILEHIALRQKLEAGQGKTPTRMSDSAVFPLTGPPWRLEDPEHGQ